MTFLHESENVRVDDGHMLRGRIRNNNGDLVDAEVNLNDFIGNNNGSFEWGGENFAGSAENIWFNIEAEGNAAVLRAELFNVEGEKQGADVNLLERIRNDDGRFVFE